VYPLLSWLKAAGLTAHPRFFDLLEPLLCDLKCGKCGLKVAERQAAAYSLLLLASPLAHGFQRTHDYLPLPKWRTQSARPSTADLINLLHQQILGHTFSSDHKITFNHFAEIPDPNPKWQKLRLSSVGPPSWAHLAGPERFSDLPQPN
jgi:hypothetical protein